MRTRLLAPNRKRERGSVSALRHAIRAAAVRRAAATPTAGLPGNARIRGRVDQDTEARVQAKLRASVYRDVRRITCNCQGGVLALHGTMSTYYSVQLAISIAQRNVNGDAVIRNCIHVVNHD